MAEHDTLDSCIAKLNALEAVKSVDLKQPDKRLPPGVDGKLTLHTAAGDFTYFFECKRILNTQGVEHLLHQLQRYADATKAKPLLFSNYISPNVATRLIGAGTNFADAAGNIYLNWPGKLYIQILGAKPKQFQETKRERLSQPSGLRVLYVLLTQPPEKWGRYRDIAAASGAALGSIAWIMRELKSKGYLAQTGLYQWQLMQKRKLLDLWVAGYSAQLRPKLIIGRYRSPEPDLAHTAHLLGSELEKKRICWALTGGFAADIFTHHFRGEQLSLFVQEWPAELTRQLRWLPSEQGRVTVLRKFSPFVSYSLESPHSHPVSHPLLVYAELMSQGGERQIETAKLLYDRHLTRLTE